MTSSRWWVAVLLVAFAAVGGLLAALFLQFVDVDANSAELAVIAPVPAPAGAASRITPAHYLPPQVGDAPGDLRPVVARGRALVDVDSARLGNGLRCSNCHFRAGATEGGRNGGVSLVGVAAKYPADLLAARVQRCFEVNLNTAGPPPGSSDREAIDTYLAWISKGIPVFVDAPWLGVPPLSSLGANKRDAANGTAAGGPVTGAAGGGVVTGAASGGLSNDAAAGKALFAGVCAQCHGADGAGTAIAPPLWGARSFTSASGMARIEVLAPFVALNMPRQNPTLSPDQAFAAAAYVLQQSRPAPGTH